MFNYVSVSFPNTTTTPLLRVYSLSFHQNRYQHEVASIKFRDWDINYDFISSGSPVTFTLFGLTGSRTFYGYVHHINVDRTPNTFLTEVVVVGASMIMKNESQQIYKGLSADGIIKKIAKRNNFVCFAVPHPRVYPQVAQAGHTDWELMVRLAKQCGYSLRAENTELYFQPMMYEFTNKRQEAYKFTMREANSPDGSTIYSFDSIVGESLPQDEETKAAIAISGLDAQSVTPVSITQQKRAAKTKFKSSPEFFDKYATDVVASSPSVAKYEAEAAENRAMFPYRATAEVIGTPDIHPDASVYLEGIGNYYAGYWTVLGTEHKVVETERNSQTYTTILHLGTDSLGSTISWTDGQNIPEPASSRTRTIIPGVAQTNIVPVTTLRKTAPNLGPQSTGAFGSLSNRAKGFVDGPIWVTGTATLGPVSQTAISTPAQTNPNLTKIPSIL